jgi:hypothetical protein
MTAHAPRARGTQMSSNDSAVSVDRLPWLELQRIAPLSEASRLSGVSVDTLKRHHGDKIIKISDRRNGMRVKDALLLNEIVS